MIHDAILGCGLKNHDLIEELKGRGLGYWTGGFVDDWTWNSAAVRALSDKDAHDLYEKLKSP